MRGSGTYSDDWKAIAQAVKKAAGWRCVRCGHPHDPPAGYCLTVHHLTGEKDNNRWWNLAALCQRCHLQIQAKVIMERVWMFEHSAWFRLYVAGYYAYHNGVRDDREYVEQHTEQLIRLGQGRIAVEELSHV